MKIVIECYSDGVYYLSSLLYILLAFFHFKRCVDMWLEDGLRFLLKGHPVIHIMFAMRLKINGMIYDEFIMFR